MRLWRWLSSRRYRQTCSRLRRLLRQLCADSDRFESDSSQAHLAALARLKTALQSHSPLSPGEVEVELRELELALAAGRSSRTGPPPPPDSVAIQELTNAAVLVVAVTSFFVYPGHVTTGSMEPTLRGVAVETPALAPSPQLPSPNLRSWWRWWSRGQREIVWTAQQHDVVEGLESPRRWCGIIPRQTLVCRKARYHCWFPPDGLATALMVSPGAAVEPGQVILACRIQSGDRILIDRFTPNFRHPRRDQILVLRAAHSPPLPDGQWYLKRLVGLPGDLVRHGPGGWELVRLLPAAARPVQPEHTHSQLPPSGYFVLGDNRTHSLDSRAWGPIDQSNIVGRVGIIYWPISLRAWRALPALAEAR